MKDNIVIQRWTIICKTNWCRPFLLPSLPKNKKRRFVTIKEKIRDKIAQKSEFFVKFFFVIHAFLENAAKRRMCSELCASSRFIFIFWSYFFIFGLLILFFLILSLLPSLKWVMHNRSNYPSSHPRSYIVMV